MEVDYSQLDVIVLTYNRAKTLAVMLESLCTQTAQGFHITVLNNASTDKQTLLETKGRLQFDRKADGNNTVYIECLAILNGEYDLQIGADELNCSCIQNRFIENKKSLFVQNLN